MPESTSSCPRPLIVVGMRDEYSIARGSDVTVVVGGANAEQLRRRLTDIDTESFSVVYSFGVAGALDPGLMAGDLLIGSRVISQSRAGSKEATGETWPADALLMERIESLYVNSELSYRTAHFLGTDIEARDNDVAILAKIRSSTNAAVVDNESHIAAGFASRHGLPFIAVRAVSDSVYRKLPPAALLALKPDGNPDVGAIARSLLLRPWQLPALIRTGREYGRALETLRRFRREVGFFNPELE